ncbi:MAG: alpha/beta hydrolase, partial [Candidatus Dormibacteraeota bacterium]|nr:alpha/beta hydrolase [Candidatus Dormibacteraeota bacterium]
GTQLECATLQVPLDYANPRGGTLGVAVARLPATDPKRRVGSLVVNPGGPGASGVDFVRDSRSQFPQEVRDRFDIVGFDPRGVGRSEQLRCLDDRQLDALVSASGRDAMVDQSRRLAEACQAAAPRLLPHLGTVDVARDLDRLRQALGDGRLTYLGFSYGTFIGALYAGLFPNRVRALVLDGAIDPAQGPDQDVSSYPQGFDAALGGFLTWCVERGGCPLGGTVAEAQAAISSVLDRASSAPWRAPDGRTLTRTLTESAIQLALLVGERGWPALRQALAEVQKGNGARLLAMADAINGRGPQGRYDHSVESNLAIHCLDNSWPRGVGTFDAQAQVLAASHSVFGPDWAYDEAACGFWPAAPTFKPHAIHAPGAETLVVGTTGDPATPYREAQALAGELGSAHLLTYRGEGHTAYLRGSSCVDTAVDTFLLDRRPPASGATC